MTRNQYRRDLKAFVSIVQAILCEEYPDQDWNEVYKIVAEGTGLCAATVDNLLNNVTQNPMGHTIATVSEFVGFPHIGSLAADWNGKRNRRTRLAA